MTRAAGTTFARSVLTPASREAAANQPKEALELARLAERIAELVPAF